MQMKKVDDRCFGECMGNPICCIYMIMRISTGQKYIGQTTDFYRRISEHYTRSSQRIDRAIKKYGKDDFTFQVLEIIFDSNDIRFINDREKFWIAYYNTYEDDFHYNEHPGGIFYRSEKSKVWNHIDKICELYQNDKNISMGKIGRRFDCSANTISRILKENNIETKDYKSEARKNINQVCDLYQNTNMSTIEIAEFFDCSHPVIVDILKENNIEMKDYRTEALKNIDQVCDLYQNTNMSMDKLAEQFNCSSSTICNVLKENNIEAKKYRSKVWSYANKICDLYQNTNITINKLAEQFNCNHHTIAKILKENNIEIRLKKVRKQHKAWDYADKICVLYQNSDITMEELAKQFNCSSTTIGRILKK